MLSSKSPPSNSLLLLLISCLRFLDKLPTAVIIKTPKKIEIITILNSLKEPFSSLNENFKKLKLNRFCLIKFILDNQTII